MGCRNTNKIRDFGEASNIHEFRDVQISNDGQYVGFRGDNQLFLFDNAGKGISLPGLKSCFSFTFSNDSKKIIMDILYWSGDYSIDIFNLETLQPVYRYTGYPTLIRSNFNNEIFTNKMSLYSNHWYTVGVKDTLDIDVNILNISYTKNHLQINLSGIEIIDELIISDTIGKNIYQKNGIQINNNTAEIPIILPSGNYLLKIVSNGKEYTSKFIVVR